jgi:hypothetical protein
VQLPGQPQRGISGRHGFQILAGNFRRPVSATRNAFAYDGDVMFQRDSVDAIILLQIALGKAE